MRIKSWEKFIIKYVDRRKIWSGTASIDFARGKNAQGYDNLTESLTLSYYFFQKK